jgi:MFS family permease
LKLRPFLTGIPYVGWVVVYIAFGWGMFGAILGVVSPELRQELGNYQDLGLLMAIWAGGSVVGAIQGGRLAHRFDPRRLLLTYLGLTAVALVLLVMARSFWPMVLGFFLVAVFEAALFTLGHSMMAQVYTDPQMRGRSLGLIDVAYSGGHLVAPTVIMGLHVFGDGWRMPYQGFFVVLFIAALAFWPCQPFAAVPHLFSYQAASSGSEPTKSYRLLLAEPAVRWAMFSGLMAAILEWGPIFWTVSFALQVQGLSAVQAKVGLQFFVVGMVAARIWQAFWHSQWTLETKLWRLSLVTLVGAALTVSSPLWMPLAYQPLGYWLCYLVFGVGVGVFFPVLLAFLIDRLEGNASKISALQVISFTVGCQLAGLVIGALSDRWGLHLAYSVLVLVACGLVLGVGQLRLAQPRQEVL